MHLVYFHPDKPHGYGVTTEDRWPTRLIEQKLDISKGRIVEKGLTIEQASIKERQYQHKNGYPVDNRTYKESLYNVYKYFTDPEIRKRGCESPEAIKKRVKNTDYKSIVKNRNQKEINLKIKEGVKHRRVPVYAFKDDCKLFFKSVTDCAKTLNIPGGDITATLRGRQKSARGYTFKYAS